MLTRKRKLSRWRGVKSDIPMSPRACPLCGGEMGFSIQGLFSIYSAVNGPYLKGSVMMKCAEDHCRYKESVHILSESAKVFARMWKAVDGLERVISSEVRIGSTSATIVKSKTRGRHR